MIHWRKSTYSSTNEQGDCVEVAQLPGNIGVRDSKHPTAGHLAVSREQFTALVARLKRSEPGL